MKTYNLIYILTFLCLLVSCSQEDVVKGGNDDVVAKIRLELSDMQLPTATKAASAEDNQIKDLWVYMFDQSGQLIYQVQGSVPVNGDATKAVTTNLKATHDPVTLMILANLPSSLSYNFTLGTSKADILKGLEFNVPSQSGTVYIPMWGEVSLSNGLYTDDAPITIPMTRSMACVEVFVDEDLVINFNLEEAYLAGTYDKGFVAPIKEDGTLQKGTISIPAGATGNRDLGTAFHKTGLDNKGTKFYIPESLLKTEKLENNEVHRSLCMVIRGKTTIDGVTKDGYYRLDFLLQNTVNEDMSLVRNTRYIFKIDAVHEYGLTSAKDVFDKSIPDNASRLSASTTIMTVGAEASQEGCIEKGLNDITTDGIDYLAVNTSALIATYNSNEGKYYAKIQIFTNYSGGWQMIDMPEGITAQQKTGAANVFYETFIWIKPGVQPPLFYIKAGGVWKTINITGLP